MTIFAVHPLPNALLYTEENAQLHKFHQGLSGGEKKSIGSIVNASYIPVCWVE